MLLGDRDDPEELILEESDDEFSDLEWSDELEVDLTTDPTAAAPQAETQPPQAETQPLQAKTQPPQAQTALPTHPDGSAQTALPTHSDGSGSLSNNCQIPPVEKPLKWSMNLHNIMINPFTSAVGPTVTTIPQTPLGIFRLFFSSDLVETIVEESNR